MRSRKLTFLDIILRDTEIGVQDLHVAMINSVVWKEVVWGFGFSWWWWWWWWWSICCTIADTHNTVLKGTKVDFWWNICQSKKSIKILSICIVQFHKISILPPQKVFCFAPPPPLPPGNSSLFSYIASKNLAIKTFYVVGMDFFWNYTLGRTSTDVFKNGLTKCNP